MTSGRKRNKLKAIISILLIFGPASFLVFIGTRGCDHKFEKLADYGSASKYSFKDINGKDRTYAEFNNSIVLVSTKYFISTYGKINQKS